jgi:hypothetical protein
LQVTVTLANEHNYLIFKKQNEFADVFDKKVDICQIHDYLKGMVDNYGAIKQQLKSGTGGSMCGIIVSIVL